MKIEDEEEKKQDKYKEENKESKVSLEEIQDNEFLSLEERIHMLATLCCLYMSHLKAQTSNLLFITLVLLCVCNPRYKYNYMSFSNVINWPHNKNHLPCTTSSKLFDFLPWTHKAKRSTTLIHVSNIDNSASSWVKAGANL